jgi:sulfane dehydrogenase subunit SoxC
MRKDKEFEEPEHAAGNGILNRRVFLERAVLTAAAVAGAGTTSAQAEPLAVPSWMKQPGAALSAYGQPSRFESKAVRAVPAPPNPATVGIGTARTPLQLLNGMITPNGLHFDRSHSGTPDIDPDQHRLLIHGLVKRPLVFTMDALARYPMESRITFLECAGNSGALNAPQAQPLNVQAIHGLLSCAEWTGVRLSTLLDEAGVEPAAKWVVAEGADSSGMSRSVPLAKCMDDAIVCLYQNGERVRPSNGYPIRLLLPGFEGNMNEVAAPAQARRRAGHGQGRDFEIHGAAQGRQSLAVRVPDGGEVDHHSSFAGRAVERAGFLRDLRPGLVGQRPHQAGGRIR